MGWQTWADLGLPPHPSPSGPYLTSPNEEGTTLDRCFLRNPWAPAPSMESGLHAQGTLLMGRWLNFQ